MLAGLWLAGLLAWLLGSGLHFHQFTQAFLNQSEVYRLIHMKHLYDGGRVRRVIQRFNHLTDRVH